MKTVDLIDLMDDDQHRLVLEALFTIASPRAEAEDVLAAAVLAIVIEKTMNTDISEEQVKLALSVTEDARDRLVGITDRLEDWLRQAAVFKEEVDDYKRYGRKGLPEGNEE